MVMASAASTTHPKKQAGRPHFIEDWAREAGYEVDKDFARATKIDPGQVSRWFNKGATPAPKTLEKLKRFFASKIDENFEVEWLFRRPDDIWFVRFIAGREPAQVEQIKNMLTAGFPKRTRQ